MHRIFQNPFSLNPKISEIVGMCFPLCKLWVTLLTSFAVSWFRRKRLLQRSRAATDAGGCSSRCVNLKSTLFSTKLCLGMISVAEIRNDIVFLSNMLQVHKEQISDLSNNLSVACRYIFLLGNYSKTILGEKQNRLPYGSAKQNTSTTNTKTVVNKSQTWSYPCINDYPFFFCINAKSWSMFRLLINEYNYDIFAICIFSCYFAMIDRVLHYFIKPLMTSHSGNSDYYAF